MAQKKLKSIKDIVASTNTVEGYGSSSLNTKQFGAIMAYNKVIDAMPGGTTIQVSMMIKGLTDKINGRPVAAHRVLIAISGVEYEHYTATELVNKIRKEVPKYRDEEKYPFMDILKMVQEQEVKFFLDKSIFPTRVRTYVIINDRISTESSMQVNCSCSDYYWTWQWYNVEANVDIKGIKPPPYKYSLNSKAKRKTSSGREFSMAGKRATSSTNPVRNPNRAYGMCKHILLLLGMLMDEDVVDHAVPGVSGSSSPGTMYRLNVNRFKKTNHLTYKEYNDLINKFSKDAKKMASRREYMAGAEKGTVSRTYFNPNTMKIEKSNKTFAQRNNPNLGKRKFKP